MAVACYFSMEKCELSITLILCQYDPVLYYQASQYIKGDFQQVFQRFFS